MNNKSVEGVVFVEYSDFHPKSWDVYIVEYWLWQDKAVPARITNLADFYGPFGHDHAMLFAEAYAKKHGLKVVDKKPEDTGDDT